MNRLFNEKTETYNELGERVDEEFIKFLNPLVKKAVADEIALKDLHAVLSTAVDLEISAALLTRNARFYLNRKEKI